MSTRRPVRSRSRQSARVSKLRPARAEKPAGKSPARPSAGPIVAERVQKLLASTGLGSRRDIEDFIRAGRVTVNGAVASLGMRATVRDRVCLDGRPIRVESTDLPRVLVYHKPEGEIVSRDDPEGRPSVFDRLPRLSGARWLNIGRLDFNTSGLLLFTTSGELAQRFAHPRFELEREYAVRTRGVVTAEEQARLTQGIELDDGLARFETLLSGGGEGANRWYRVVLREGRNRLVRRLFEAAGHPVSRLIRVRFGPVALPPRLRQGQSLELPPAAVSALLRAVGAAPPPSLSRPEARPARPRTPGLRPRPSRAR